VLSRLAERGEVIPVQVEGVAKRLFFVRALEIPTLEAAGQGVAAEPAAAFIAPLDNVAWDRELLRQVFAFDYCLEIYKPKERRDYGYYVLPVLYGDRFIARVEPVFDKKARVLRIAGWWWEKGIRPDVAMKEALGACTREFAAYLGAATVELSGQAAGVRGLKTALALTRRRVATRD